jgi:hypothetical protein
MDVENIDGIRKKSGVVSAMRFKPNAVQGAIRLWNAQRTNIVGE